MTTNDVNSLLEEMAKLQWSLYYVEWWQRVTTKAYKKKHRSVSLKDFPKNEEDMIAFLDRRTDMNGIIEKYQSSGFFENITETNDLIRNCFQPGVLENASGWTNSPSMQFYELCTKHLSKIAEANTENINGAISDHITEGSVFYQYDSNLTTVLMSGIAREENKLPIVWKTLPWQMKYHSGKYICVLIDPDPDETVSQYNLKRSIVPRRQDSSTQRFFQSIPSVKVESDVVDLKINLRTYLFHMLMYQKFNSLDSVNYTTKNAESLLHETGELGFRNWLDNNSQKEIYALVRNGKDYVSDLYQREALLKYAKNFKFQVEQRELNEIHGPNITLKQLILFCTHKISPCIVKKITELRHMSKRYVNYIYDLLFCIQLTLIISAYFNYSTFKSFY